jgi:hypothetical protein
MAQTPVLDRSSGRSLDVASVVSKLLPLCCPGHGREMPNITAFTRPQTPDLMGLQIVGLALTAVAADCHCCAARATALRCPRL